MASDEEFIQIYQSSGSNKEAMERLGVSDIRSFRRRLKRIEEKVGTILKPHRNPNTKLPQYEHLTINDFEGVLAVFSDAHFWPNEESDSYKILLQILPEIKPDYIISNGDEFDGSSISRFAKDGWSFVPSVADELKACKDSMKAIKEASESSKSMILAGNHTNRLQNYLVNNVPEFVGVEGFSFQDHFQDWEIYISASFNDHLVIKHNYHGGIHAAWNNVLKSGVSIVTGHTHRLLCRPYTDYRGTRYGIETGTLCNIYGQQFKYMNNNPRDWMEGFCIITVDKNTIHPELVSVVNGTAFFRGKKYYT